MPRSNAQVVKKQVQVSSYERLCHRINAHIAEPHAQIEHRCRVERMDTDHDDDWERVVDEMREVDGLSVERKDDGYEFTWKRMPTED
ncbi:DUF1654 domain-containing protein [Pseudomonas rhizoryzae]|uniref:DUF1654 domain-containing protein n=1 Tax=Pseudomonas rhizoryzae TaxID=2571129 RepID=UPI0010C1860D|nr:DUF1654 domain-containing protein [Pseudomonas rhizoryzae]